MFKNSWKDKQFIKQFFFSSRRRHTRYIGDWSSDVCSSDLHPKQSESRHRHLIAPSCGCLLFSATFSGRIWTSRKTPIKTGGTMMNANHAMTFATESSVSPWNMEAWARDGSARNVKAMNRTKRLPRGRRALSVDRMVESCGFTLYQLVLSKN